MYQLADLNWQWDWLQGPRLQNLRILVCKPCYDIPQESGRTIHLPPDPIGIQNARPENYVAADNPASYLGFSPSDMFFPQPTRVYNIGTMNFNGGIDAAFDANATKTRSLSATTIVSNSSYGNWVGKNWNGDNSGISAFVTSTVAVNTHIVSTVVLTAPVDAKFLNSGATGYHFDVSTDGVTWTTVESGTTAGTIGESITITSTATTAYQYHRVAIQGDGVSQVAIAQAVFNISDAAVNDI